MSSGKAGSQLEWSFGLRNSAGKYLTAEAFQNKIVCVSFRGLRTYPQQSATTRLYVLVSLCLLSWVNSMQNTDPPIGHLRCPDTP